MKLHKYHKGETICINRNLVEDFLMKRGWWKDNNGYNGMYWRCAEENGIYHVDQALKIELLYEVQKVL